MPLKECLNISSQVKDAVEAGMPVVALESTVITHGLPYPDNLEVTQETIEAVTSHGAIPAIILIADGCINVGLSEIEAEELARSVSSSKPVFKASISDIGPLLANGSTGSTTVAATMFCANLAGIRVFATGGIGGVHRGASDTFDISNDLQSLRDIPVAVVSSGAKSILDIPKTLEVLETFGVCVAGYKTDSFPSFYGRDSEHNLLHHTDDIRALAKLVRLQLATGHGVLVGNPVPEEHAVPSDLVEEWVERAASEASAQGIYGKSATPFMLGRVSELSKGKSLQANRALLINNASTAAMLSKHLISI